MMRGRKAKAIRRFLESQRHLTPQEATNVYRKFKKDDSALEFKVIDHVYQVTNQNKVFVIKKDNKSHVIF